MRFIQRTFLLALVLSLGWLPPAGPTLAVAQTTGSNQFGLDFVNPPDAVAGTTRFSQAEALGVGLDRFPLYWSSMQPNQGGPINFSATDATVSADLAHGLAVQGILVGAPSWATTANGPDLDAWATFVSQVVTHYKGQVQYWEIWNEPDLLNGQGQGQYWPWGVAAYYQLLKTGYLAAKQADPTVTVIMGGLAFPYNNQDFLPQLLDQIAQDPTATANHGYFDVLAFHSYDRVDRMYQLPVGYLGTPSFGGFRPLLQKLGLHPPIWANEIGVPVWDYGSGQNAPGRATQNEQASYVVEALADGLAGGVSKFFVFQLYDDGAGAVDPRTNLPAEYFGLVANDGTTRPAYGAYQSAVTLFAGVQAATHLTLDRGSQFDDHKGVEVVTLYGTTHGKVTIAWNDDPGNPITVGIPTGGTTATQIDQFGHAAGRVSAANGTYTVTLPGATNNNNFDCYTPQGCDPNDYVIGGTPVILLESDASVPAAVFDPLPLDSEAPFTLSWHSVQPAPTGATYDVQFRDATDGVWHDWLVGTTATSATFGAGSMQLQPSHSYEFRLRMHDANGNLIGGDYPAAPLASTVVIAGNVQPLPGPIDGKIEIVWPVGNAPVSKAIKANVTADLFQAGTTITVNPAFTRTVRLWQALDSGVGQPVITGTERLVQANGLQYPVWDFNGVDVSAARSPQHKYYFWTTVDGERVNSSVWSHGTDARTYFPQADQPTGVLTQTVSAVDAKIEVVWPHGNQPVTKATQANISADLFAHGTLQSLPASFAGPVRLYRAIDSGPLQEIASADEVMQTTGGVTYPTWQFNNVDVSAARDPSHRIYFMVLAGGVKTYPNIWTHGADARTFFPHPDVPTGVAPLPTSSPTPAPTGSVTPAAGATVTAAVTGAPTPLVTPGGSPFATPTLPASSGTPAPAATPTLLAASPTLPAASTTPTALGTPPTIAPSGTAAATGTPAPAATPTVTPAPPATQRAIHL